MSNLEKGIGCSLFFFAGLLSGGVIGLLLAPKAGKEVREDIVNKSTELSDQTKKEIAKIHELGYNRIERLINSWSFNKNGHKEELAHSDIA